MNRLGYQNWLDRIQQTQQFAEATGAYGQAAFALLCELFLFLLDWRWGDALQRSLKVKNGA